MFAEVLREAERAQKTQESTPTCSWEKKKEWNALFIECKQATGLERHMLIFSNVLRECRPGSDRILQMQMTSEAPGLGLVLRTSCGC